MWVRVPFFGGDARGFGGGWLSLCFFLFSSSALTDELFIGGTRECTFPHLCALIRVTLNM